MRTLRSEMTSIIHALLFWVSVAIISGIAGFIGGDLRRNERGVFDIPSQPQTVILADRTRGAEERAANLDDILSSVGRSMISLYQRQQTKGEKSQFVGFALAVTSDGWLVTTASLNDRPSTYTGFTDANDHFSVTQIVSDPVAGYTFLKIQDMNLRPIEFASFTDAFRAEEGYLIRDRSTIERMIVTSPRIPNRQEGGDGILKTTQLTKVLNPATSFETSCMPVIRDARYVFGCTTGRGVRSFRYLQRSLSALLKNGTHGRSTLDIPYINLALAPVSTLIAHRTGALIVLDQKKTISLTVPGGAALDLRNGDIILSVNGEAIDQNRDLGELIAQYSRGETVSMRLISGGVEKERRIILN